MFCNVAFHDRRALSAAASRPVRSRWPHLRLVPLVALGTLQDELGSLPPHTARIVVPDPDASVLGSLSYVVSGDPAATAVALPQVPRQCIVTWEEMEGAYRS